MSKRITNTDKIELVETQNLCLALNSLSNAPYDVHRWKRAFYHALCMSEAGDRNLAERIRIALGLP